MKQEPETKMLNISTLGDRGLLISTLGDRGLLISTLGDHGLPVSSPRNVLTTSKDAFHIFSIDLL